MGDDDGKERQRDKDRSRGHRHRSEDKHHRKRRRDDDEKDHHHSHRHKSHKSRSREKEPEKHTEEFDEDMWEEKPVDPISTGDVSPKVQRQTWMTESKNDDKTDPFSSFLSAPIKEKPKEKPKPQGIIISSRELNTKLQQSSSSEDEEDDDKYIPPTYTIGDSGSSWRMMKLKNIYTAAKESMRTVEDVAMERMGSLRAFDDAREEEQELDRRKRDRRGDGVNKVKITGELYNQRLAAIKSKEQQAQKEQHRLETLYPPQKPSIVTAAPQSDRITQSDLNRLQANLLRAEMVSLPNAPKLAEEYAAAVKLFNTQPAAAEVVILPASASALLPHLSRDNSKSDVDLTIEDMVREERASKRSSHVDRIARDKRFKDDLDYLDENAEKLAV